MPTRRSRELKKQKGTRKGANKGSGSSRSARRAGTKSLTAKRGVRNLH